MSNEYRVRDINLDKLAEWIIEDGQLDETPALHLLDTIRVLREHNLVATVKLAHAAADLAIALERVKKVKAEFFDYTHETSKLRDQPNEASDETAKALNAGVSWMKEVEALKRERDEAVAELAKVDGGDFYCPDCKSQNVGEIGYDDDFGSMECQDCGYQGDPGEDFPATLSDYRQGFDDCREAVFSMVEDLGADHCSCEVSRMCNSCRVASAAMEGIRALTVPERGEGED